MNIEKIFSFLGKENTASPEKILSTIEESKSEDYGESEKVNEFLEEEEAFRTLSMPRGEEESSKAGEEVEELLSIFDLPLPTYEAIRSLTIPDVMKETKQQPVAEEEAGREMFGLLEESVSFQPKVEEKVVGEEGGIEDLIREFKVEGVEEKAEEVSAKDLEGLLGVKEEEQQAFDIWKRLEGEEVVEEEKRQFEFGREEQAFDVWKGLEGEKALGEAEEQFGFGGIGEEEGISEKAEEIVKGIEQAEEVEFKHPLEEFYEEQVFEELESEAMGKGGIGAQTFEEVTEVKPEEMIYREEAYKAPERKPTPVSEETRVAEGLAESDVVKAVSLLKSYPSDVRKAVRDLIENRILSEALIDELFRKILTRPSESDLKNYIKSIAPFYRFEEGRRVIIAAKKSKAEEALEKLLKRSVVAVLGVGVIAIVGFIVFTVVSRNIYSENLYNRGLKLIDTGYYDEAESLFRRAEEVGGRKKEWYTKYAIRYLYNNVPERAVRKIEDGLKVWPYDYRLSLNYVDALTRLPQPDFDRALRYSEEFRRREENSFRAVDLNAQVYTKMGDYYKSKHYYKEAELLYMKYLKGKDNKHIPSLFRLVSIYIKLDKKDRVDEMYDYIKRLDENAVSEPVGIELIRYYIDKGDLDRARKVVFELSTIKPKDPDFYYEFARYLFMNENYRESVKNLKVALSLNPKHAKSYVLIGNIEYMLKNKASAFENYKKAIEIDPSQKEAYFRIGDILYESKDYNGALGYYLEGIKLGEPESVEELSYVYYNLAKIYYRNGMLNESLRYLSHSYLRFPQNPLLSHFMGNIYLELGKPDMAVLQYDKSIEGYLKIMEKIKAIDPGISRHRELVSFLIRSYNNQGVAYILLRGEANVKNAMLSWWEAKNYAEKINSVYPNAEYNLKLVLHPTMIKYRNFAVDREIPDSIPKYVYTYLRD
ncbi:MAG: tetratricopeptide repeat protein [Brevinematia bacterium]